MFENLTDRLGSSLKNLAGQGSLTEDNIRDTLREVRKALLEADVALPVVKEFVEQVKEKALGQEVLKSLNPGQAFVKIVNDELVHTMGDANDALNLATKPPAIILMAGLQGAGKTTSVAKLARFLQEREKKKVMVVSADVYRPAAIEQLKTLAGEVETNFFPSTGDQDPVDIANGALEEARRRYRQAGGQGGIVAKIERAEAVADDATLDAIILASDGVMVARGDLAVEIGDAELVGVQKHIIRRARALNRFVITATQMMESMIHSPQPTRAEVSDVANAVLDGTDAVMLSAETAVGEYPVETVQAMDRIILGAERTWQERRTDRPINDNTDNIDEVIAMAAMQAANRLSKVTAIIAMTESGNTPRLMSRLRSGIPIYAFTPYPSSQRRVAILRGVRAIPFDSHAIASDEVNRRAVAILEEMGAIQDGDRVLITKGNYNDAHGGTNTLKVIQVGGDIQ